MRKQIFVTFEKEGIHAYPEALTNPNLEDVKFLGYQHRHMFKFKVTIDVTHNNRDIEFIQFKRWLLSLYEEKILSLQNQSCEMMAEHLIETICSNHPGRDICVEVSEDGENGAIVTYEVPRTVLH